MASLFGGALKKSDRDVFKLKDHSHADFAISSTAASLTLPDRPVVTTPEHLTQLRRHRFGLTKRRLTSIARRELGGAIDLSFPCFIHWLQSERYSFRGFDEGPLRFDERCVYLRYDVHRRDLFAAYILAELHERLKIAGSFQIAWMFTKTEEGLKSYFLKLLKFDQRFVQFGLHTAPTASWYSREKLGGGDYRVNAAAVAQESFTDWLLELHDAYTKDGDNAPGLREIRQGTDDTFSTIAASFRSHFGDRRSISGHGNFLSNGFHDVCVRYPQINVLKPYFYPVEYFARWGVARFGFDHEVTALGSDAVPFPRVLHEGDAEAIRRERYRGRVAHGAGFVALLHPATWTCRHNATFFLPEDEVPSTSANPPLRADAAALDGAV